MQLSLANIHKSFGPKHVLQGLNFHVESGRAFGLLGRNGSGKTTTARIILDVFLPDEGSVRLDGGPMRADRATIGYLPEEKGMYPKLTILDQLVYFGELRGLSKKAATTAANEWLERVDLAHEKTRKLETLSKGNQQKIQLICALLTDPPVLILDEPFSGLDPINAKLLKTIVAEQVAQNKLVLFSSHQMPEVESFCDDIAILHEGKIALAGRLSEIKRTYPQNRAELRLLKDGTLLSVAAMRDALRDFTAELLVKERGRDMVEIVFPDPALRQPFLQRLLQAGFDVDHYAVIVPSLEDIFVATTGEEKHE